MTLVDELVLILLNDASLSFGVIEPSSGRKSDRFNQKSIQTVDHLHRTYLIPSSFKKGSSKSSILVNCEKMIVFSSELDLSSIWRKSLSTIRTLADVGRSLSAFFAFIARGTQSVQ